MIIGELIAAFAELVVLLAIAALMLLELALSAAALLLEVVLGLIFGRREQQQPEQPAKQPVRTSPIAPSLATLWRGKWLRRIALASVVCLALTAGVALLLNTVFFDWSARKLIQQVARRSGITIDYASATGNLFTGHIVLRDATLIRRQHQSTAFDL